MNNNSVYIVTFQNAINYGAALQCYALQHVISKYNNNIKVLNYDNNIISNFYKPYYFKNKTFKQKIKTILADTYYLNKTLTRNKKFKKFFLNNIKLTKKMKKNEILNNKFKTTDKFIAGSDQIWNTFLTEGYDPIYYLDFNIRGEKYSYAASIGTAHFDKKYQKEIENALKDFKYLSVREKTAKIEIENKTNLKADVVLDPTLLLEKKEWKKAISKPNEKYKFSNYIFIYMPDDNCIEYAKKLSIETNKKIVYISRKNIFNNNSINVFCADPFDFIQLIENADYIVTTSFHAVIFSIIFNKEFMVSIPDKVGSRITDLLDWIDLKERIINKANYSNLTKKIEKYNMINSIIMQKRNNCEKIIKNIIEG